MSIIRNIAVAGIAGAMLAGCASSRYSVIEPAAESVADFTTLEIRDFTSNLTDKASVKLADSFADRLYTAVMADRAAHPGESIFEQVVRGDQGTGRVLVLDGTVISFDEGSRAMRYFVGFGAGKAYCTIRSIFTNKETGNKVLETNFDGELSMGVFGGSAEEAVDAVVRSYIEYFDEYFEKTGVRPKGK